MVFLQLANIELGEMCQVVKQLQSKRWELLGYQSVTSQKDQLDRHAKDKVSKFGDKIGNFSLLDILHLTVRRCKL